MTDRTVRIGGASGAWGDSPRAIAQLLNSDVQYLMMDYLAEVTMSLLARARLKDPEAGFPPDFVSYLKPHLAELARRGIKVASNAGGVNPQGCKRALEAACAELGLDLKVAVVEGDDVLPRLEELRAAGIREAVSGEPLPPRLLTANAYLGALPIAAAFDAGADIVVTGRCADSALALGILLHEFGWSPEDHDLLAAGSLAGHVLECGPQATGGTFTDWEDVPGWDRIGYPIAECRADGSFVLSKPEGTGGLVIPGVVAEQVLYEVGDPAAYILPDVVADFSGVSVTAAGPDRVLVQGARGRPPTPQYKVSATFQDGYRATATVSIVGPDAARKAERTAEALLARGRAILAERGLPDFTATHVEALGAEASYGADSRARATREVLLRLVVDHSAREALDRFARELGSIGLSCAPGTTGIPGGRPKPTPVVRLFTFFLDKPVLGPPRIQLGDGPLREVPVPPGQPDSRPEPAPAAAEEAAPADTVEVPLLALALARSGDKGDSSNIAIIARHPALLPVLRREVTPERMAAQFRSVVAGPVRRFEAPGLHALNFLLDNALGGGGMASRRIDPQGKAYGQRALEMTVRVPRALLPLVRGGWDRSRGDSGAWVA
ncbi:acyclic terpene utilization AtuA family protein [Roseomonas sp. BN140053]|uniref:acyclic terpene utilization AtuA family protein n=1 Tax=Roseomonas sp. BN140053 TaxID=3391898 RepID=UPI0039E956FB